MCSHVLGAGPVAPRSGAAPSRVRLRRTRGANGTCFSASGPAERREKRRSGPSWRRRAAPCGAGGSSSGSQPRGTEAVVMRCAASAEEARGRRPVAASHAALGRGRRRETSGGPAHAGLGNPSHRAWHGGGWSDYAAPAGRAPAVREPFRPSFVIGPRLVLMRGRSGATRWRQTATMFRRGGAGESGGRPSFVRMRPARGMECAFRPMMMRVVA